MLRLNNVSAGYRDENIISEISLELIPTEILGIVGLNGAGKSTLLRTMLGLIPPSSGEIFLKEKLLKEWNAKERAQWLSLLDSDTSVCFPMNVTELLELGFIHKPLHERRDLRGRALEAVGLEDFQFKNVLEMSSGEAKRAFIAHLLSSGSKIMMMDEPFAHLDWSHQASLAANLNQWRQDQGTTFVLAIHELEWAVKVADRVCVIHEGKIVACGKPEKILTQNDVREIFAFRSGIDENPLDGSKRLTLSPVKKESESTNGPQK